MKAEDYLEEAKLKFPIGSHFNNSNLMSCTDRKFTVKEEYRIYNNRIVVDTENGWGRRTIWKLGRWAVRIDIPEEFLTFN